MIPSGAKKIDEALRRLDARDALGALPPACAAVESAAHRELPRAKEQSLRFRAFFATYAWVLERVAFGGALPARLSGFDAHPSLKKDAAGTVARDDALHELTRTALIYAARVGEHVVLASGEGAKTPTFSFDGERFLIPPQLPLALLVAAILSPTNEGLRLGRKATLTIGARTLDVDAIFGQADIARSLLR